MSKLLSVGQIERAFATEAALTVAKEYKAVPTTWLGRVKTELVPWLNCEETIAEWDFLNDASVSLFLHHAAELEGIPPANRIGHSRWPHLPDYLETYWLPIDFPIVRVFKGSDGWPIAIASAPALLRDLDAVEAASPLALRQKPAPPAPNSGTALSPEDALRWIWCCLHEAASDALANNAPLAVFS